MFIFHDIRHHEEVLTQCSRRSESDPRTSIQIRQMYSVTDQINSIRITSGSHQGNP